MSRNTFCELQGEDHPLMFKAQRNHIRVNSDQRKRFRGAQAVLVFTSAEVQLFGHFKSGGTYSVWPCPSDLGFLYGGDVESWLKDYMAKDDLSMRIVYKYALQVSDDALTGEVCGIYRNTSQRKGDVVRRIRRMVGSGLTVLDTTPKSRAQILSNWKEELVAEAKAYVRKAHANVAAKHQTANVRNSA